MGSVDWIATLPAMELLLPGVDRAPQPAGVLLVCAVLRRQPAEAQQRQQLPRPRMHLSVVVYCRQTGELHACRKQVKQDERGLYRHPRCSGKWTWDSR